jgi:hypothetical protein
MLTAKNVARFAKREKPGHEEQPIVITSSTALIARKTAEQKTLRFWGQFGAVRYQ